MGNYHAQFFGGKEPKGDPWGEHPQAPTYPTELIPTKVL